MKTGTLPEVDENVPHICMCDQIWIALVGQKPSSGKRQVMFTGRVVGHPELEDSGLRCCSVSDDLRLVCDVGTVESRLFQVMTLRCGQLRRILAPHPPTRYLIVSAL